MEVLNDLMDAVRSLLDLAAIKLGVEPEVFTTSVISSFLAVVIWSAYTLFVVCRVIQKGGDDKSVGLRREESKASATNLQSSSTGKPLNPAVFQKFKLIDSQQISHDCKLMKFEIPGKDISLGLPIGRHVSVRAKIGENNVMRAYTPCSSPYQAGYFELMLKSYEMGKMSTYLHSLRVGDTLEVRGPVGRFKYAPNQYNHMGLIAGGTGLTPCLQVIRCVFEGKDYAQDKCKFTLYYQNRKEEDILLKQDIDDLVAKYPDRLRVVYYLSNCSSKSWDNLPNCKKGYIDESAMREIAPRQCQMVCLCGPSGFNDAMKKLLLQVGHVADGENASIYVW